MHKLYTELSTGGINQTPGSIARGADYLSPGLNLRGADALLGVPMHRTLGPMAAALATRLRRTACLLVLATSRRIGAAARVGEHVSARTHDSDQHHGGECPKRYSFHCVLPFASRSTFQ